MPFSWTEGRFDLITVDLMLGQRSGWEIIDRLHQEGRRGIRILVLSALNSERHITEGLERGIDHYLLKPFSVDALLDAVEHVLSASAGELAAARRAELQKSKFLNAVETLLPEDRTRPAGRRHQ